MVVLADDTRFLTELPRCTSTDLLGPLLPWDHSAAVAGRVVTEGTLVFELDPILRVTAEVRARMLYHDFLPFETVGDSAGLGGLRRRLGLG